MRKVFQYLKKYSVLFNPLCLLRREPLGTGLGPEKRQEHFYKRLPGDELVDPEILSLSIAEV